MIVHPDFLDKTVGHFYRESRPRGSMRASRSSAWLASAAAEAVAEAGTAGQAARETTSGDVEQGGKGLAGGGDSDGKPSLGSSRSSSGTGTARRRWPGWVRWRQQAGSGQQQPGQQLQGTQRQGGLGKAPVRWAPKSRAALLQTPQDFFNVDAHDPMASAGAAEEWRQGRAGASP